MNKKRKRWYEAVPDRNIYPLSTRKNMCKGWWRKCGGGEVSVVVLVFVVGHPKFLGNTSYNGGSDASNNELGKFVRKQLFDSAILYVWRSGLAQMAGICGETQEIFYLFYFLLHLQTMLPEWNTKEAKESQKSSCDALVAFLFQTKAIEIYVFERNIECCVSNRKTSGCV